MRKTEENKMLKQKRLLDLQLFTDANTNVTTQTDSGASLSAEMKTFYDKVLIKKCRTKTGAWPIRPKETDPEKRW